jgi:hypothetical protein
VSVPEAHPGTDQKTVKNTRVFSALGEFSNSLQRTEHLFRPDDKMYHAGNPTNSKLAASAAFKADEA